MAGGRPSVYDTKIKPNLREIKILRANGTSIEDIARIFNVSRKTIYNHINEVDEFLHTIKKGSDILVEELEATLYDLAKGKVVRKKTKINYDSSGNPLNKEETEEQLAPNVAALIFSLTNLAPDRWTNKQEVNLERNDDIQTSLKDELRKYKDESGS